MSKSTKHITCTMIMPQVARQTHMQLKMSSSSLPFLSASGLETSLYYDNEFLPGPDMPFPRHRHILVKLSPTRFLLYGGIHLGQLRLDTAVYDFGPQAWTHLGPCPMHAAKGDAAAIKDKSGNDVVVAIGTSSNSFIEN